MDMPKLANLHGQVAESIATQILSGHYSPGETLPVEQNLCTAFGVSRTTLRGAVKELIGKRLLDVGPSRGTRVRPKQDWNLLDADMMRWRINLGVDRKLIREVYEMRECFEPRAAALAAERGTTNERHAIAEAFEKLALIRDGSDSAKADVTFHVSILVAAGNDFISSFSSTISMMLRLLFEIARGQNAFSEEDVAQHRAIRDAILRRDGRLASAATEVLLVSSKVVQMALVDDLIHLKRL